MRLRSAGLWQFLLAFFAWSGIAFFGRQNKAGVTDTIDTLLADLETVPQGADASLMVSAFLKGLQESKLLADSSYDSKRRVAKFKIAGGGAYGDFLPEYRIWLRLFLGPKLQISWEKIKTGVRLRFSGMHFAPLAGADELYVTAGLDSYTCASFKSVSQEEFYQCHLKKALMLEDFWKNNRSSIPKNLQQQFSFIGDNTIISHLAEQLGHGFGWSMLLVLSAPPSNVDIIDFTDHGVKGALVSVRAFTLAGAKLSQKHGFKDLSLNIARPLVGDTHFGGIVRSVGEKMVPVACNFGILCSGCTHTHPTLPPVPRARQEQMPRWLPACSDVTATKAQIMRLAAWFGVASEGAKPDSRGVDNLLE
eukprot:g23603.t1